MDDTSTIPVIGPAVTHWTDASASVTSAYDDLAAANDNVAAAKTAYQNAQSALAAAEAEVVTKQAAVSAAEAEQRAAMQGVVDAGNSWLTPPPPPAVNAADEGEGTADEQADEGDGGNPS